MILSACGSAIEPIPVSAPTDPPPPPPTQEAVDSFRVAVLMPSAVNDLAFSQSMYDSLLRVQEIMGGPEKMEFVYSQGMFVIEDAAAALRTYASQEYDLVIAHGSQYGESLKEIAPEYPETSFAWGTTLDTFGIPNIFAYEAASQEGGYVNGVLAANLTTSNVIGIVGPIETGDAKLYVEGFKAGVLATNPEITVHVEYIGSFSDVVLASETATRFVDEGADILTGTAQMVVGATSIAVENNALWFGTQSNQSSLAPSNVVASQVYHWEVALKQIIDNIQLGIIGGRSYTINLGNGGEVIEYNPDYPLPEDVKALADNTKQGIINGSIPITLP
jgi:basic membrane protein A